MADRTRRERATVGLYERLAASVGETVLVRLVSGRAVSGAIADVGQDWMLLRSDRRPVLVPLAAAAVSGLSERATGSPVGKRFSGVRAARPEPGPCGVAIEDVTGATTSGTIDAGLGLLRPERACARRAAPTGEHHGTPVVPFAAVVSVSAAAGASHPL